MSMRFLLLALVLCIRPDGIVHAAPTALEYSKQRLVVGNSAYEMSVPQGYLLEVLNTTLDGPRMLTFNDAGELFIGSRSGRVYRLHPPYTQAETMIKAESRCSGQRPSPKSESGENNP